MRINKFAAIMFLTGVVCLSWLVQPAMARGGGYWKPSKYDRIYNRKTVETISGIVEDIRKSNQEKRMPDRIDLILKSDKETVSIHLGPQWFMEKQTVSINKGDNVEVTESRVKYNGTPAIIAAEVKKEGQTLDLRNAKGSPLWRQR